MTLPQRDPRDARRDQSRSIAALIIPLLLALHGHASAQGQPQPVAPADAAAAAAPADAAAAPADEVEVAAEAAPAAEAPAAAADTPAQGPIQASGKPAEAATPASSLPLSTTFRWGGYVKLDAIYSSTSRGLTSDVLDYLVSPGGIVVANPDPADNFNLSARESRFWLATTTPTAHGDVGTHVEVDFLGLDASLGNEITTTPTSVRLRHAYGTFRGFLAGQNWSTWMDLAALPEVNDFGSPAGRLFARQGMIRYTRQMPAFGGEIQIALENPETTLTVTAAGDGALGTRIVPSDDRIPDTVVKVVKTGAWGHLAASGIVRLLRSDGALVANATDSALGFGGHVSGKVKLGGKHNIAFDAAYGRGIGRYVALATFRDGEIDAAGNIDLIDVVAATLTGQVWLSEGVRINLTGSMSQSMGNADLFATADAATSVNKRLITVHSNVMWNPVKTLRLGIEHIFVQRTLENDDITGDMHRFQAAAMYTF